MRSFSKMFGFAVLASLALPLFASAQILPPAQLNKIYYQFTEERWVTTDTAKVTVNFDAVLDKVGLNNVNKYVVDNLNKIADKAAWHIVEFSRTKDASELEKLHVVAEARLADTALAGLRDKAKAISKPGETYTIADVDFTPSNAEFEKAHVDARAAIYEQAKQEVARLNATYADQKYFLNEIRFNPPQPMPMKANIMSIASAPSNGFAGASVAQLRVQSGAVEASAATSTLLIDSKITEVASVTVASLTPEHQINQQ